MSISDIESRDSDSESVERSTTRAKGRSSIREIFNYPLPMEYGEEFQARIPKFGSNIHMNNSWLTKSTMNQNITSQVIKPSHRSCKKMSIESSLSQKSLKNYLQSCFQFSHLDLSPLGTLQDLVTVSMINNFLIQQEGNTITLADFRAHFG